MADQSDGSKKFAAGKMAASRTGNAASDQDPTVLPQSRETRDPETLKSSIEGTSVTGSNAAANRVETLHVGPGTELGYYRLEKKLGEGGMGSVWQALHTKLDSLVAVKVLPETWNRDPALLSRFEREMKAVGKLKHPNIVRAMDAGEFQGTHYLVMEFNEGQDLSQWVKSRGPQAVSNACEMLRQAALGLAHAHEAGLIHRDIKPSNLFLTKQGKVQILDLGLARVQGENAGCGLTITGLGQVLGTPDYMAPEQWENTHAADARSDLYALGCTLFYLLTGKAPFSDEKHSSLVGKMKGHTLDPIPDLRAARREAVADRPKLGKDLVSDELDALYRRLMSKQPAERFATAAELAQALAAFGKSKAGTSGVQEQKRQSTDEAPAPATAPVSSTPLSSTQLRATVSAPLIKQEREPDAPSASPSTADEPTIVTQLAATSSSTADPTEADPTEMGEGPQTRSTKTQPGNPKPPSVKKRGLLLAGLAALILFGAIIIKITKKDGTTLEVTVPDGTKKVEITESEISNSKSQISDPKGWHGWPADAPPPAIAPFDAEQAKQHQEAWAKYLKVPVEYTNTIGMKFRLIPPGEFTMGSTKEEIDEALTGVDPNEKLNDKLWRDGIKSEAPQHKVVLTQPIYLGVHEVTQAEYEQVMGTNPSYFALMGPGKEPVAGMDTTSHPVEMVSWNDAAEFCAKLSQKEKLKPFYFRAGETITPLDGAGYRLPTEAEWECACRAGTTTKYWISDKDEDLARTGWLCTNSGGRTHTVEELKANPFGLYDIHGNVWEWVQDVWEPTYYGQFQEKSALDPNGGPSSAGSQRVIRGGDWHFAVSFCHASNRPARDPTVRHDSIGFRVSLVVGVSRIGQALKVTGPAMPKAVATTPSAPAGDAEKLPPKFTNRMGMEFVLVGKGTAWLGGGNGQQGEKKVEMPEYFYLGKYEVTQAEWERVTGLTPSHFSRTGGGKDAEKDIPDADLKRFPVEQVSWDDAQLFLERLNKQEPSAGWVYRLPREDEWEYACRGGPLSDKLDSAFDFYFDKPTNQLLPDQANFAPEPGKGLQRTCKDGSYQPNRLGLYDMCGYVWELCEDKDVRLGQTKPDAKICRGGDWNSNPNTLRRRFVEPRSSKIGSTSWACDWPEFPSAR